MSRLMHRGKTDCYSISSSVATSATIEMSADYAQYLIRAGWPKLAESTRKRLDPPVGLAKAADFGDAYLTYADVIQASHCE